MTREDERNLEIAVLALLLLWSDRLEASLRVTLVALIADVIKSMRDTGAFPTDAGMHMDAAEWKRRLNNSYEYHWKGAAIGGLALMAAFIWKLTGAKGKPPSSFKDLDTALKGDFGRWIDTKLATAWMHVMSGVRQRMNRMLAVLFGKEMSAGDAIDRIEQEAKEWARIGAQSAATTEMNGSTNKGFELARRSVGLQGKMWRNPLDSRTRRPNKKGKGKYDHWKPNGQVQKENDPFLVSGESLMFPGDMSLGATIGNIANCFHPETTINAESVVKVMRSWHSGKMIEVKSSGGHLLTVTESHRILVESGWQEARLLSIGQAIFGSDVGQCEGVSIKGLFDAVAAMNAGGVRYAALTNGSSATHGDIEVFDVRPPRQRDLDVDRSEMFGRFMSRNAIRVDEIRTIDYVGFVYDVQTESGAVVADGIVCHNCRCWTVPYFGPYP